MAMLSAMNSGIAGLRTYGRAMSVIGDNIANVNTTGFKQSRANFQDVMVRSLSTGTANVNSVGFGSEIGSIQALHSQGSFESTENPMDLGIGGAGYFKLRHVSTGVSYYSRAGQFHFDAEGFLVNPQGYIVQGYLADQVTGDKTGAVTDIKVSGQRAAPNATTALDISVNLDSQETVPTIAFNPADDTTWNYSTAITVYDSLGTPRMVTTYFRKESATGQYQQAALTATIAAANNDITYTAVNYGGEAENITIQYIDGGNTGAVTTTVNVTGNAIAITVTTDGANYPTANAVRAAVAAAPAAAALVTAANATGNDGTGQVNVAYGPTNLTGVDDGAYWNYYAYITASDAASGVAHAGAAGHLSFDTGGNLVETLSAQTTNDFDFLGATANQQITLDFSPAGGITPSTGVASASGTFYLYQDGYAQGALQGVSVDTQGRITGAFSNGQIKRLAYIILANFNNPEGLRREGGNLWGAATEAGTELIGDPRTLGLGEINGNTLEQSNVDLAEEFVNMISNQRAYQANSRVITTSDQMLETLMQLKR
ncbi:MAG: flagellar hook protein FlgE [Proteobacteria bacterium]|nr:flagellar hook protein FlgE [Pseudomonadota bacterium]